MTEMLVSVARLQELIAEKGCVIVDCRFDLSQPDKSEGDFTRGHIPGAVFAHLDRHLSSAVTSGSGRHPLPDSAKFVKFLTSAGWEPAKLLVAYDDGSNAFSGRLWWLMRYFKLDAALLDGGFAAWKRAELPQEEGNSKTFTHHDLVLEKTPELILSAMDILNQGDSLTLVDARAPERFAGTVEPLDSRAGHIPGALNRPLSLNLTQTGEFKKPAELRREFEQLLGERDPASVVHYCGSGVTACHNAFAMELAGFGRSRVYPGSWSEWIRDPARPVETGS